MLKAAVAAAVLAVCSVSVARADDRPGPDWISMEQAIKSLHAAGYGTILEMKADEGYWKAKAVKEDAGYKISIDPRTGRVERSRPDKDD